MKICVYGAGAIGGLMAAWLARAGHEVFIDKRMKIGVDWSAEITRRIDWCVPFGSQTGILKVVPEALAARMVLPGGWDKAYINVTGPEGKPGSSTRSPHA